MENSREKTTPKEPNLKLARNEKKSLADVTFFRQLGSLFYLTITRPDIAFSTGAVSQFMDKPHETHLIAAKRILCYIKGTLNYGLMYEKSKSLLLRLSLHPSQRLIRLSPHMWILHLLLIHMVLD